MAFEPQLLDDLFNNTIDNNNQHQQDLFNSLFDQFDTKIQQYPDHTIHDGKYGNRGCQLCSQCQHFDPIISNTTDAKPSKSNEPIANNDVIDLFDWDNLTTTTSVIPYHSTHHDSKYAEMGCQQCIAEKSSREPINVTWPYIPKPYTRDSNRELERKRWMEVHEKKMKEWECSTERDWRKQNLITFGYIRRMEKKYKLFYDVPNGVKQMVSSYVEIFKNGNGEKHIRQLICTIQNVLPKDLNWKPIKMTKLLTPKQVKKGYYKCVRMTHPDRSIIRGDDIEAHVICAYIFETMERAYNKFYEAL